MPYLKNLAPLQVTKFRICKKILSYKLDNDLNQEEIAERLNLSPAENRRHFILLYRKIYLDRLFAYTSKLFETLELEIIQAKVRKSLLTH